MDSGTNGGGWKSFPFIIGSLAGMSLAGAGVNGNLIVYLIREFNIKSITAAQVANVANGTSSLSPIVAAIVADSFFGSFTLALLSSCVSLMGTIILILTTIINKLKPYPCNNGSNLCNPPSKFQYAILYGGIMLSAIGFASARFTTASLGANQLNEAENQDIFFNWFLFTWYICSTVSATGLFYIQDNVSWAWGFIICAMANLIGLVILLLGYRFYRPHNPQGTAFLDLARVLVASMRKWKSQLSSTTEDYYSAHDDLVPVQPVETPGKRLRFFNRAALITNGDLQSNGLIEKSWRLCTVQHVEDFKAVIGILPLWSSSIFLSTPIAIQSSITVLQALATNRHIGSHFKFPAGSIAVIPLLSTAIFLTFLDRILFPAWQKLSGKSPTPLQRIGVGHVFNVLSMFVSALVESKRLKIAHSEPKMAMSVLWLFPQLVLVTMGESFHFPAQVSFFYQQLPQSMQSTSTAMISMISGISFYLGTALINQVRRSTNWLPDDINHGRLDNFYWMLVLVGSINFVYYLICSTLYKHAKVMDDAPTCRGEAQNMNNGNKQCGSVAGMSLAGAGIIGNLIVYLIREFNIKSITAAQVANVTNGSSSLFPILAAIVADSFFGSFPVAFVSSCVSFLGTVIIVLTSIMNSLKPDPCSNGSNLCNSPSKVQYGVLYGGIALSAIGFGGARFTTASLGANQFNETKHHDMFFNWFFLTWYIASIVSLIGVFYVQDNVSWPWGFGICCVANLIGLVILLLGYRFYRPDNPQRSAFLDLARVLVASIRKWNSHLSSTTENYYSSHDEIVPVQPAATPGKRLRFFNRAALITDGDLGSGGSIEKPWRLCTVQQVEDLKAIIGILPLWSSSIFLSTPIGSQGSMTVLQALAMNRHIGPHFNFPAGSITIIALISTSISLCFLDRVVWPAWAKLNGKSPTTLQRIGIGHVFNVFSMVVSALVESKRLKITHFDPTRAMSVLWLFPQLVLVGIGESFHFPGQVAFYYQQLPQSLRSTSTAMISMIIGIAFYLSTLLINQVRRSTDWLPDDINHGRVDNFYWMLVLVGSINFVYYLLCSTLYKHTKV
ncbi:Protein NRT1/ PTR FAMILY 2.6, partial [Mucuna pruriens]